jgi:diacylglycerol kinase family enzyme
LLTLAGAIAVGISVLIRNPLELVAAMLLIGLAVVAVWAALVRRGARRWIYAAITVFALAGITLLPDLRTYWAILLVILCALSALAVRFALGHDLAPRSPAAVGPAVRGALLMNPRSGGGKVAHFELDRRARDLGVIPVMLEPGDDLRALAERAVADGADVLGMAGGDGSQALVADVARRHDIAFVCVPAGTCNHFALDLGLDGADVVGALAAFGEATERRVDLATLGDRVFVNNTSLGVYATVVQSPTYRDAKVATLAQRLPDLLGPDARKPDLCFECGDGTFARSADVLVVSNGACRLEHIDGFGNRERLDTGRLGIVTISVDRARDVPALMTAEIAGMLTKLRGYRSWVARAFVVNSAEPYIQVGIDGEALRLPPPLWFRSLPGALRVRVPREAAEAPAAAAPLSFPAALAAVSCVLVGRAADRR